MTGRRLTHLDAEGNARMVDVSAKDVTVREAVAKGRVVMAAETLRLVTEGKARKGDVLAVARIAGIMAAKRTHDLIPLCHPLALQSVTVDLGADPGGPAIEVTAMVRVEGRTGVEMEALTAVTVACLTVYDMLKAADRAMRIEAVHLVEKSGGRSGHYRAE
jgi:cyclic pyranopterin phosphate synthase